MRLIDADELMEHVWRDKLDSRELIAQMIENAPTVDVLYFCCNDGCYIDPQNVLAWRPLPQPYKEESKGEGI